MVLDLQMKHNDVEWLHRLNPQIAPAASTLLVVKEPVRKNLDKVVMPLPHSWI